MPQTAKIILTDLALPARIGTYGPGDTVPEAHLLDLTLWTDPALVLVAGDGMAHVFDYDPLVAEIDRLARDGHYATQEWLMTRIARACAAHAPIRMLDMTLRKHPVRAGSGALGVSLHLDAQALAGLR
ncbi:MAG: dihydroneopterin aldolase [Salibaculum sp.]|jgi:dihydroneopterin aldolase|uniref:dihydroneopterin aldolase n=1 Tax=Salibaculum sp. TaxID=2855480 RepID=UPI00286FC43D|nr:dihydroneopterin aldolase [Salibaculum sp.]MDR9426553.1 dihydroneopterin aldolase [Salibaculum sp.]MDR9481214.1 dihydroneopterin aldolase [Salibaculum sp.]